MEVKNKLISFLNKNRTDDSPTHLSYGEISGKFKIDDKKTFMKLYSKCITNNVNLSMLETQIEYGPYLIDIDLKRKYTYENDRLYTTETVQDLINKYILCISKYVADISEIKFCVFEKNKIQKKDELYKDGFHIMILDLYISSNIKHVIRKDVIKMCKDENLFNDYSESVDKIIDEAVIKKNAWFMYGSTKPGAEPYKLTKIYDENLEIIYDTVKNNEYTNEQLIKIFSIQPKDKIKPDALLILDEIDEPITKPEQKNIIKLDDEMIIKIIDGLNDERSDDYTKWLSVGWALFNSDYDVKYFDYFSKKSNKYKGISDIIAQYTKYKKGDLNISYLWHLLKIDNINLYEKLKNERIDIYNLIYKTQTDYDIAKFYYNNHPDKYIFCQYDKYNDWYVLKDNNKWKSLSSIPIELYKDLPEFFKPLISDVESFVMNNIKNEQDPDKKEKLTKQLKPIYELLKYISNTNKIKGVTMILQSFYNKIDIKNKMDADPFLLSFDDKLYDFKLCSYRDIKPDDYITMSTGYDAPIKSIDKNRKVITDFIHSIFEDEEYEIFYLKSLASSLCGDCKYQNMYIHTGCGSNGKSLSFNLIKQSLGDYFYTCDSNFLTKAKQTETNSTLCNSKGKRILFVSEPEDSNGEKLQVEFIKKITGGEEITTRDLYKSNTTYKCQFTVFLACNKKPELTKADFSIARRLKIQDYPLSFVDNPTEPTQRKINRDLEQIFKQPQYRDEFMILLLEYYEKYIYNNNIIEIPTRLLKEKDNYIKDNNIMLNFVNDMMIQSTGSKLSIQEFYNIYVKNYENICINKFSTELKKIIGVDNIKRTATGIQIINYAVNCNIEIEKDELDF